MLFSCNRHINYLRISVTDRCNLRCSYCMPEDGIDHIAHSDIMSFEQICDFTRVAVSLGITKVRLTGGEPLVRRGIDSLFRMLGTIEGIEDLTLTTNGITLKEHIPALVESGVKRVNISLDTVDSERYREITRIGSIESVFAGIDEAISCGLEVKINQVILPYLSEKEIMDVKAFCDLKKIKLQRIRYFQPNVQKSLQDDNKSECKNLLDTMEYDRPYSCQDCNRIRLLSNGVIQPCLHSSILHSVDFSDIRGSIERAVEIKPDVGTVSDKCSLALTGG